MNGKKLRYRSRSFNKRSHFSILIHSFPLNWMSQVLKCSEYVARLSSFHKKSGLVFQVCDITKLFASSWPASKLYKLVWSLQIKSKSMQRRNTNFICETDNKSLPKLFAAISPAVCFGGWHSLARQHCQILSYRWGERPGLKRIDRPKCRDETCIESSRLDSEGRYRLGLHILVNVWVLNRDCAVLDCRMCATSPWNMHVHSASQYFLWNTTLGPRLQVLHQLLPLCGWHVALMSPSKIKEDVWNQ